ncbi:putative membrane protein [Prevotella sp. ICM33]|uniref:hypothetical protein n=1 Tax=Prevotella sp. ICM33 TaxID=1161412 RepID=UPI000452BEE3|nr:hypothetical protein [Prevotella sp. ICM33]ETT01525.1 putative membrane protein [Prevotella sp. ICM33]
MNLKAFSITPKEGQVLNWSLGLFIVFSVFNLIDGWTSVPNAGQGVLTNAFATVQSNSFIRAIEYFVIAATQLAMLEVFRRCLNKNGDKAAQLIVTIMMSLIFCLLLAGILPRFLFTQEEEMLAFLYGGLPSYFTTFSKVAFLVFALMKLVLCVQLVRTYAGKIRLFGASLFGCQVLTWLIDFAYFVVYTWVSGATMTEIMYVSTITSLLSFVLALIPFCVLKTTMVVED